ncbi:UbiB-like protein kinase [Chloropicon primus]|uniref:UbiB-like protein kinase n=1 Tax=Chloropicon primus TaxID=1764295 RepID=A0A5B8MYN3_9CHLO|nr:UbiB-like protein kinase [Chloropicon primus]UPR04667.1 UbiB-like protein kinase [Chloropicon primus]|mmetsp:Transcript_1221/g.3560  ORF Transcript_1221/g.3560 Transcript_1221/m.3560 type:complete len:577 (-) Transcript_1221:1199-2929(-)|eukprot:QDZ25471.1 UbiB-like protein kinase [Chloropicon primus]
MASSSSVVIHGLKQRGLRVRRRPAVESKKVVWTSSSAARAFGSKSEFGFPDLEKARKLAQDAFQTIIVDSDDPIAGAKRVAQALQAGASVLGEAIESGESEALIKDATDAFRQAVAEIEQQQDPASPTTALMSSSEESLKRSAKLLRKFFEKMGAAYVKLGQFIASSPTLFPKVIVDEFQECLDSVPPLSYDEEIYKIIQQELGGESRVREVFTRIDKAPLASASIAQVHRGTLRSTGESVVLKVCKPDVAKSLRTDLDAVYLACRAFELFDPTLEERVGLSSIIQDARDSILAETNLEQEAKNMQVFREFLSASSGAGAFRDVYVPKVYKQYSTRKVLVMEELRGVSLSDYLEGDAGYKRMASSMGTEGLIIEALNAWIASVGMCESFHADVHAGNLFVLSDGRLAFIDFGSVGRISPKTKRSLENLAYCLPRGDWRGAASALVGMGAIMGTEAETSAVIDPLARDLEYMTDRVDRLVQDMMVMEVNVTTASIGALSGDIDPSSMPPPQLNSLDIAERINRLVLDVVDIAEKRGLRFPREFALLIKQMLYFDRFVQELAPELDVLTDDRVDKTLT